MYINTLVISIILSLALGCWTRKIPSGENTIELLKFHGRSSIIAEDFENIVTIVKKNIVENQNLTLSSVHRKENDYENELEENVAANEELIDGRDFYSNRKHSTVEITKQDKTSYKKTLARRTVRKKRSIKHERRRAIFNAKVEVCIVIDYKLYNIFWMRNRDDIKKTNIALEKYFAALIAMVNERYKEINEPRVSIKVLLSDLWIAQSIMEASWVERHRNFLTNEVVATHSLESISQWLEKQKVLRRKYDHVMVFTGYPLVNVHGKTIRGIAYVGEVCDKTRSVSIIHDEGKYQSAGVAAHELGHSLGAFHDGYMDNAPCPAEHNYIMTPVEQSNVDGKLNYMYLSQCSIKQISQVLSKATSECVFDKPVKLLEYNLQAKPPGRRFTPDQQCSMVFGEKWKLCDQKSLLSNMCSTLWCQEADEPGTCRTIGGLRGIPGTRCGDGKMCWRGMCVNEFYKSTKSTCLAQRACNGPDKNVKYCQKLIEINAHACERQAIASYCCESCSCNKTQKRHRRRKRDKQRRRKRRHSRRRLRRKAAKRKRNPKYTYRHT
ncbi:A disintegrin and metalloproteinase with thrombospondin motifs 16-like [Argonauta hians]